MRRQRRALLVSLLGLVMACLVLSSGGLIWLFSASPAPGTTGGIGGGTAEICVGIQAAPRLQVGASLDACWICSSLTPWMQRWPTKLCARLPWPAGRLGAATRIGFEFPP